MVELGSAFGLSGSYLASALAAGGSGELVTIEGSPSRHRIASETIESVAPGRTRCVLGFFDDHLHELAGAGLVFVDGNHQPEPTRRYAESTRELAATPCVIALDDVRGWTDEFTAMWTDLAQRQRVLRGGRGGGDRRTGPWRGACARPGRLRPPRPNPVVPSQEQACGDGCFRPPARRSRRRRPGRGREASPPSEAGRSHARGRAGWLMSHASTSRAHQGSRRMAAKSERPRPRAGGPGWLFFQKTRRGNMLPKLGVNPHEPRQDLPARQASAACRQALVDDGVVGQHLGSARRGERPT